MRGPEYGRLPWLALSVFGGQTSNAASEAPRLRSTFGHVTVRLAALSRPARAYNWGPSRGRSNSVPDFSAGGDAPPPPVPIGGSAPWPVQLQVTGTRCGRLLVLQASGLAFASKADLEFFLATGNHGQLM